MAHYCLQIIVPVQVPPSLRPVTWALHCISGHSAVVSDSGTSWEIPNTVHSKGHNVFLAIEVSLIKL